MTTLFSPKVYRMSLRISYVMALGIVFGIAILLPLQYADAARYNITRDEFNNQILKLVILPLVIASGLLFLMVLRARGQQVPVK